jgi:hypothetical protein
MNTPRVVPKLALLKWTLICAVALTLIGVLTYPLYKQTLPCEIIRSTIRRVPPAQLWADDLADDVRNKKQLAHLQDWSVQTMERFRAGKLATQGEAYHGIPNELKVAAKDVPSWLQNAWWDRPKISILLNESNEPQCIVVGWYLCGLEVGPTNFVSTFTPWYIARVKPGIYAYSIEK